MEEGPSLEANRSSASQAIPRIHKRPSPVPIRSQINPFQAFTSNFLKIHFLIFLPFTSRSSKWSLPLRSLYQNPVCASVVSHSCSGLKDLNKSIVSSTPIYVKAKHGQVRNNRGIGDTEKDRRLGLI